MYSHDSKLLYYTTKKSTGLEVVETYDLLTDQIINKTNVPSHFYNSLTWLAPLHRNRLLFSLR